MVAPASTFDSTTTGRWWLICDPDYPAPMGDSTLAANGERNGPARLVLAVAVLLSAALLLHYRLQVGFIFDDLLFLKERGIGGFDSLLEPHNGNVVALQAAFYRVFFWLFGIGSAVPLQIATLPVFLFSVVAFFGWARRRIGEWAAVILAIPLLFLGTGYQDLVWAFQIGYTASLGAGIVALICLESDARHAKPVALVALCVAIASSSLGAPFLAAAAVLLLFREGWRGLLNYALLVPVALLVLWYLGWGHTDESFVSSANLTDVPRYVAESVKSVIMGLTGLHRLDSPLGDILGWLATALAVAVTTVSLVRRRSLPRPFVVALVLGLAFWALASANQIPGTISRDPDQSRYQLPGAVFLLMIFAGAFEGFRPNRNVLVGMAALAGVSVACSIPALSSGTKVMVGMVTPPKAAMTALDIAGDRADPAYRIRLVPFFPYFIDQNEFGELEDRYGRAGWSEGEVESQSETARGQVDASLVAALGLKVVRGAGNPSGQCTVVRIEPGGSEVAELHSGKVSFIRPTSDVAVRVSRFADSGQSVGGVAAGRSGTLAIPGDRSQVPWRVAVAGEGKLRLCATD
jgi:hypothetical protein